MNQNRKNGILTEEGDTIDFNKIYNLTFFEDLPENMQEAARKAGFKLDNSGFVIDENGNDVTYDDLKELSEK